MKNLFTRLNRRKGFTLVECLIALTVFAALTLVVFAILANARMASTKANDAEENLTKIIDNVVGDETYVRYNSASADSLKLNLSTGGTPFSISYSEIDGYKNYVFCTNTACSHFADNSEFMSGVEKEDFTQGVYVCPKCSTSITQELFCEDCNKTGDHTDTTSFTYIPSNGGYYCNDCGGTGVRGTNINDTVISNYDLNVKSLVPNAIVYGDVTRKTNPEDLFDTVSSDSGFATSNVNMTLITTQAGTAYTYDMYVSSDYSGSSLFQIHVQLPPGYTIANLVEENGHCAAEAINNGGETFYVLKFYDCVKNASSRVTFQLINNTSGKSFDEDYGNDSDVQLDGLRGYWFQMGNQPNKTYNGR